MPRNNPLLVIAPARSRALLPARAEPAAQEERRRRRYWFAIDQGFNVLVVSALLGLVAVHQLLPRAGAPGSAPATGTSSAGGASSFVTASVTRGDLAVRVAASGTVEPVRLVEVSTELSGMIRKVHVENNDTVRAGQVLAELDNANLISELRRAEAQVAAAAARIKQAEAATVAASKELSRKRTLAARDLAPARDLDNATASSQQSSASVEALTAELRAAEASRAIAKANLDKGTIVSPIDGIVLRRNVEPGQAVAASLQAPVLFRLAQDLSRMQIRVDVDEADALSVRPGQAAAFTVQALRDRPLQARVEKLFVGPEVVQGVVTYKAILSFDNTVLGLRPGMTAMADIVVDTVRQGLLVPNAALRFSPPEEASGDSLLVAGSRLLGTGIGPAAADDDRALRLSRSDPARPNLRRVWIERSGKAAPVEVEIGASDGIRTAITRGALSEGQQIIVDFAPESAAQR